jgi:hypothetical protein
LNHIRECNQKARKEGKLSRTVTSGHKGHVEVRADEVDSRTVLEFLDGFLYLLQLEDFEFDPDHPDYVPSEAVHNGIEIFTALKDLVNMNEPYSHSVS